METLQNTFEVSLFWNLRGPQKNSEGSFSSQVSRYYRKHKPSNVGIFHLKSTVCSNLWHKKTPAKQLFLWLFPNWGSVEEISLHRLTLKSIYTWTGTRIRETTEALVVILCFCSNCATVFPAHHASKHLKESPHFAKDEKNQPSFAKLSALSVTSLKWRFHSFISSPF